MKPVMLIPALGVAWVAFCLFDLVRAKQVRYLPKWGWVILCCGIGLTVPFGGILYLWVGRERYPQPPRAGEPPAMPRLLRHVGTLLPGSDTMTYRGGPHR